MTTDEKVTTVKRKRCYNCKQLKHEVDMSKRPVIDKIQCYICSEECWIKYLEVLSGWYK